MFIVQMIISSLICLVLLLIIFQMIYLMHIIHISSNFISFTIYLSCLYMIYNYTKHILYIWNVYCSNDHIVFNMFGIIFNYLSNDLSNAYHWYFMKFYQCTIYLSYLHMIYNYKIHITYHQCGRVVLTTGWWQTLGMVWLWGRGFDSLRVHPIHHTLKIPFMGCMMCLIESS